MLSLLKKVYFGFFDIHIVIILHKIANEQRQQGRKNGVQGHVLPVRNFDFTSRSTKTISCWNQFGIFCTEARLPWLIHLGYLNFLLEILIPLTRWDFAGMVNRPYSLTTLVSIILKICFRIDVTAFRTSSRRLVGRIDDLLKIINRFHRIAIINLEPPTSRISSASTF